METHSRLKRKKRSHSQKFGEFTLVLMPDENSTPIQLRMHIAPVLFALSVFFLLTIGTGLMLAQRLSTNPAVADATTNDAQASLELVSAEIASLMRNSQDFSNTVNSTVAQFGAQPVALSQDSMDGIILSDNTDNLPAIARQFEDARISVENIERLFSLNQRLLQHIPNQWPLAASRGIVTMEFGPNMHPFTRQMYLHKGFDIADPRVGTPILAVADGVVESTKTAYDYGMYVRIRHRFGFRSLYAHMSSIRVSVGERVSQGQMIGTLGSTGLSTGPHLHLELWMENQILDPAPFLSMSNDFNRRTNRNNRP